MGCGSDGSLSGEGWPENKRHLVFVFWRRQNVIAQVSSCWGFTPHPYGKCPRRSLAPVLRGGKGLRLVHAGIPGLRAKGCSSCSAVGQLWGSCWSQEERPGARLGSQLRGCQWFLHGAGEQSEFLPPVPFAPLLGSSDPMAMGRGEELALERDPSCWCTQPFTHSKGTLCSIPQLQPHSQNHP